MSNFAYLHLHTRYSRGGGPAAPDDWCRRAAELGYATLGFTDRSPLVGLPSIYKAAKEAGLTPLYGIELDLLLPTGGPRKAEPVAQPAILFARSREGMLNLARIASEAYSGWPGHEKALDWDIVAASPAGLVLILLGGDEAGALTPVVGASGKKQADWAGVVKATFGDAAYVGVPHSGRPGDNVLAAQVVSAAVALGLPVVATPTARYLRPEDAPSYEALKAARKRAGWPRDDTAYSTASIAPDRPGHDYLRAPDEAAALYSDWPQAIENVARIAEMCAFDPGEWPFQPQHSTEDNTFLRGFAEKRLLRHLSLDALPSDLVERLDKELDIIDRQAGGWVALSRLVGASNGSKSSSIPVGAPIGTADGSLLAYALGISPLNPLGNTSPSWLTPGSDDALPNPGVEIPATRRDELITDLARQYGPGRLAHAGCSLPISAVQAVQVAGGVLGISGDGLKSLALTAIEKGWDALSGEYSGSMARVASLALTLKDVPSTFHPDPDTVLVTPRETHGALTLASCGPLLAIGSTPWLPWSEEELCALGYPAFTLYPTRFLSLLDTAIMLARRYPVPGFQAADLDLSGLPILSEAANNLLRKGDFVGIPYLKPAAVKGWTGEATLDVVGQAVARSLHPSRPPTPDPKPAAWDDITAATGGTLLFKDQFTSLLHSLGISIAEAAESDQAEGLWSTLSPHSKLLVDRDAAAAWGRIALWSVAVKAAHPAAFLAAALSTAMDRVAVSALAEEAHRLGVKLEAPDVNRSAANPTLQRDGAEWVILWGLDLLPGWRSPATERFLAARPASGFSSLRDVALAAVDAGLSISHLETLIRSGACDSLGTLGAPIRDHAAMLAVLPAMLEWARATRQSDGQLELFASPVPDPPVEEDLQDEDGHLHTRSPRERYLRRRWEQANIGVAFTGACEMDSLVSTLEKSGDLRSRLISTAQVGADHLGTSIYLVGILCSIRMLENSKPSEEETLAVGRLEDADGSIELVAFPSNYKRHAELWTESNLVVVTARVSSHDDGEIYLLCEHMAPFQAGSGEEAMTLTIKPTRQMKATAKGEPSGQPSAPAVSAPVKSAPQPMAAASAPQPVHRSAPQPAPVPTDQPATYSLVISIPPAGDDHAVIDSMIALNTLLSQNPGPDSVTLRVQYSPETGRWTSARLPMGVRFTPSLENAIRRLLGDDALAVIRLAA